MGDVLLAIVPLYVLFILGFLAGRMWEFRDGAGPLNAFVYYFALPAFLFDAVANAPRGADLPATFFVIAFAVPFGMSALTYLLTRRRMGEQAGQLATTVSYGNVGYFGFPIVLAVLGPAAALPAALAQQVYNLTYMIGYPILRASGDAAARRRAILRAGPLSPFVIAVVLGAVVRATRLEIPPVVASSIALVGQATIPVALFAVGLALVPALRALRSGGIGWSSVLVSVVVKNVVLPLATWGVDDPAPPGSQRRGGGHAGAAGCHANRRDLVHHGPAA